MSFPKLTFALRATAATVSLSRMLDLELKRLIERGFMATSSFKGPGASSSETISVEALFDDFLTGMPVWSTSSLDAETPEMLANLPIISMSAEDLPRDAVEPDVARADRQLELDDVDAAIGFEVAVTMESRDVSPLSKSGSTDTSVF